MLNVVDVHWRTFCLGMRSQRPYNVIHLRWHIRVSCHSRLPNTMFACVWQLTALQRDSTAVAAACHNTCNLLASPFPMSASAPPAASSLRCRRLSSRILLEIQLLSRRTKMSSSVLAVRHCCRLDVGSCAHRLSPCRCSPVQSRPVSAHWIASPLLPLPVQADSPPPHTHTQSPHPHPPHSAGTRVAEAYTTFSLGVTYFFFAVSLIM